MRAVRPTIGPGADVAKLRAGLAGPEQAMRTGAKNRLASRATFA